MLNLRDDRDILSYPLFIATCHRLYLCSIRVALDQFCCRKCCLFLDLAIVSGKPHIRIDLTDTYDRSDLFRVFLGKILDHSISTLISRCKEQRARCILTILYSYIRLEESVLPIQCNDKLIWCIHRDTMFIKISINHKATMSPSHISFGEHTCFTRLNAFE